MKQSAKLPTEPFSGGRYSIVAWGRGHEILFYREFGSYQGEWALFSFCDDEYYIWKGSYGSCSGCDSYEAQMGYGSDMNASSTKVQDFIKDYQPFIEIPRETMARLAEKGYERLLEVMPANVRDDTYGDFSLTDIAKDACLLVKIRENLAVSVADILEAADQEVKRTALKLYGYEKFCTDAQAKTLDESGEDKLIGIGDILLLSLKDSSTDRRYLLGVPPNIRKVKEGVAWTFGLDERTYKPLKET